MHDNVPDSPQLAEECRRCGLRRTCGPPVGGSEGAGSRSAGARSSQRPAAEDRLPSTARAERGMLQQTKKERRGATTTGDDWQPGHHGRSKTASLKAAVHWVRVNALSAESSPNLTLAAMGLRADSARWLSVRAEPLTR